MKKQAGKNPDKRVQQPWVQRYPMHLGAHAGQSVTIDDF